MYKSFRGALKFVNTIPRINQGGCAIAALAMKRWVDNNKPESSFKFVILNKSWDTREALHNMKISAENNKKNHASCAHVCVNFEGKFYDSRGPLDISDYKFVEFLRDDEEAAMVKAINDPGCGSWNYSFDRDNVKLIAEKLEIELNDIKID